MSFSTLSNAWQSFDFEACFNSIPPGDVQNVLDRAGHQAGLEPRDLLTLLSPAARDFLEPMAQIARDLTCQHFGRTIGLYAPVYISDFCCNHCTYCGFNAQNRFPRTRLTLDEIDTEARAIAGTGIRHILILTGESPGKTPLSYLKETCRIMTRYFSSIALEVFPMAETDYRELKQAGADSLTVYQEVYDKTIYQTVHPRGPKSDYTFRLFTPERAAAAGFRAVNIGPLFGLGDPASEAFMAGLHARYLEQTCPEVEVSLSLPRMTRAGGAIAPRHLLSDRQFVQTLLAWRLFIPRVGITISTRESAAFRDRLIPLGVTRYSAGSKTDVGGYAVYADRNTVQFEVTDARSVDEVAAMIRHSGYQPCSKTGRYSDMKIGIAGAGGIGSNVARHLAQAGMPHLFLVDFDEVAPGNLNRQFYSINQVGCPKVDCLKQNLLNIHPTMRVETLNLRLKPGSMARIFSGCDVVVEGLDDPAAKKQLVEALAPSRTPVVSASGIAGHDMDTITVRTIGNCHMVGDFSTDIAHAPLFPPKLP